MAIIVECHKCSTVLELDDGFRGGVCRCGRCGALLQVPLEAGTAASVSRRASPDTLPQSASRPDAPTHDSGAIGSGIGSGIRRPAAPPAGSGAFAGSGGLSRQPSVKERAGSATRAHQTEMSPPRAPASQRAPSTKPKKRLLGLDPLVFWSLMAVGLLFLVAVGLILWQILGQRSRIRTASRHGQSYISHSLDGGQKTTGPQFLGIPLTGDKIVFSLDGSSANTNSFSYVTQGVQEALATLAPDQQFRVAIWRHKGLTLLPARGWLNRADVKALRPVLHRLRNALSYGSNDTVQSMLASLALGGNQVIFVTAKFQMPHHLVATIEAKRRPGQRLDVISVDGERRELQKLAQQCDGQFRKYSVSELNSMTAENSGY